MVVDGLEVEWEELWVVGVIGGVEEMVLKGWGNFSIMTCVRSSREDSSIDWGYLIFDGLGLNVDNGMG